MFITCCVSVNFNDTRKCLGIASSGIFYLQDGAVFTFRGCRAGNQRKGEYALIVEDKSMPPPAAV